MPPPFPYYGWSGGDRRRSKKPPKPPFALGGCDVEIIFSSFGAFCIWIAAGIEFGSWTGLLIAVLVGISLLLSFTKAERPDVGLPTAGRSIE